MTGRFCAQCACYAATFSVAIGSLVHAEEEKKPNEVSHDRRYVKVVALCGPTAIPRINTFNYVTGQMSDGTVPPPPANAMLAAQDGKATPQAATSNAAQATGVDGKLAGPGLACFSTIPKVSTFNYITGQMPDKKPSPPPLNLMLATKEGKVEAKVVARDANHVRVFLKNPGKTPLTVQLPEVLAARPVLAQAGNFFNPGGGPGNNNFGQGNNNRGGGQAQAIAGPMTFGQSQNNNQGGNGVFAIPPESVREIRVRTVCLDHGKPEPKSSLKYELVDFAEVGGTPQLEAVLVRYGRGDIDEQAVQAATWHIANGKSWQELAAMSQLAALNATTPIFSSRQLQTARQLADGAEKLVAQQAAAKKRATEAPAGDDVIATKPAGDDPEKSTKERLFSTINARK